MSIWKPHVTVAAVIEDNGRFLMVEEDVEGKIVFNQPAGHLEPGEGLVEAAIRETLEETGYHFSPQHVCGIYRWVLEEQDITYLRVSFCGSATPADSPVSLDEGIIGPVWLSREELLADPSHIRSPMVTACIDDYLAGRRYSLDIINNL